MSDEPEAPQGDQPETPQGDTENTQPQGPIAPVDASDTVDGWKATATKWQKRAKTNDQTLKDLREQVKQLVDPQEVATVEGKLSATELELQQAQASATKYRVALEAGLTPALAKRLVGSSEDEIRADAETLRELVAKKPAGATQAAQASGPTLESPQSNDLNALLRVAAGKGT